jgi:hypothetical protein
MPPSCPIWINPTIGAGQEARLKIEDGAHGAWPAETIHRPRIHTMLGKKALYGFDVGATILAGRTDRCNNLQRHNAWSPI